MTCRKACRGGGGASWTRTALESNPNCKCWPPIPAVAGPQLVQQNLQPARLFAAVLRTQMHAVAAPLLDCRACMERRREKPISTSLSTFGSFSFSSALLAEEALLPQSTRTASDLLLDALASGVRGARGPSIRGGREACDKTSGW